MAVRKPKMAREVAREKDVCAYENRIKVLTMDVIALEDKICTYMETAGMYKAQNDDLRARIADVEEMLRQTEISLENEYTSHTEQVKKYGVLEKEIESKNSLIHELESQVSLLRTQKNQQEEMKKAYFNAVDKSVVSNGLLKRELEEMKDLVEFWHGEYEKEVSKSWWRKVFNIG